MRPHAGVVLSFATAALMSSSCSSTSSSSSKPEACSAGEAVRCIAASGCAGLKVCGADGRGFSECKCDDGGAGAAGGGDANAGDARGGGAPPSCDGLPATCGPAANEDCCTSPFVPTGTYNRSNNPAFPATVSDFRLDRFEVTVGRFRKFVAGYPGNKPTAGAGAHARIANTGWDPAWNSHLPADASELTSAADLICSETLHTWTDQPGVNETLPINCLSWYLAFAFCAWDGGRLPTEAEWNYVAAGGSLQREYPWGSHVPDPKYAVFDCTGDGATGCALIDILRVGSKSPIGDGQSFVDGAHADLAGNVWEWTLDYADFIACCNSVYTSPTCTNCANLSPPSNRVVRGGGFNDPVLNLATWVRESHTPNDGDSNKGVRCARNP